MVDTEELMVHGTDTGKDWCSYVQRSLIRTVCDSANKAAMPFGHPLRVILLCNRLVLGWSPIPTPTEKIAGQVSRSIDSAAFDKESGLLYAYDSMRPLP